METEKKSIREEWLKWIEAKKREGKIGKDLKVFSLQEVLDPNFKNEEIPRAFLKQARSTIKEATKKFPKEIVDDLIKTSIITIKGKTIRLIKLEPEKIVVKN